MRRALFNSWILLEVSCWKVVLNPLERVNWVLSVLADFTFSAWIDSTMLSGDARPKMEARKDF